MVEQAYWWQMLGFLLEKKSELRKDLFVYGCCRIDVDDWTIIDPMYGDKR